MFRLSRQTKILSPALLHRRTWPRGFHDEFIPGTGNDGTANDGTANDGTGNDGSRNDGRGGRSDILWDRINRIDDKIDGCVKDHGNFKVDVVKSIGELGIEFRESMSKEFAGVRKEFTRVHMEFAGVHQKFAELKSDQKLMKWQVHFLFFGASSLVLWTLKDYIQLRFPAFFASEKTPPPHEQPEAPPHGQPEAPQKNPPK